MTKSNKDPTDKQLDRSANWSNQYLQVSEKKSSDLELEPQKKITQQFSTPSSASSQTFFRLGNKPSGEQRIDRYIIKRVLGSGAMGSVYAAWDPKLHREVALKIIPARISNNSKGRERFLREVRAMAAARHPNIVEIYDYSGTDSPHLYLVIEKLEGEDLYATMNRLGILPESVAAAIGHELCSALQVAHDCGMVHRDLKPENVFCNLNGRVVLTDFGIAKAIRDDSALDDFNEKTDVMGTPGFMAPEMMTGRSLTPAVDIFALGALLYNVTTKRLPFEGSTPLEIFQAASKGRYIDPRQHNPYLSKSFCKAVAACIAPDPKQRPRSAEALRQLLKDVLEENGVLDVRDELHNFLKLGENFREQAKKRSVQQALLQLKVAAKDHDQVALQRYRQRILLLDPYNESIYEVSGVIRARSSLVSSGSQVHRAALGPWYEAQAWLTRAKYWLIGRSQEPSWVLAGLLMIMTCGVLSMQLGHTSVKRDGVDVLKVAQRQALSSEIPYKVSALTKDLQSKPVFFNEAKQSLQPTEDHRLDAYSVDEDGEKYAHTQMDLAEQQARQRLLQEIAQKTAQNKKVWVDIELPGYFWLKMDGQWIRLSGHRSHLNLVAGVHKFEIHSKSSVIKQWLHMRPHEHRFLHLDSYKKHLILS